MRQFGSGGDNAPILLVVGNGRQQVPAASALPVVRAVDKAAPGARVVSYAAQRSPLAADGRTGVVMVYPHPVPGADAYAAALPALQHAASILRRSGVPVAVTGQDALQNGGGGGGSGVLAETLFGGVGALVVLVLVFGSFLALMPLVIAVGSILTTFLIVWGLTGLTDVSFIVQYLLALIGLGVARTGRLITSAALILFLAFIALSRGPTTDVKILATALALGIIIDATIVRGILAPALVAALGPANWWTPRRPRKTQPARPREQPGESPGPVPATQHTAPEKPG
jgi:hypothetical protein